MKFCLFGAAPDTSNLGVSALCHSVVAGLLKADPRTTVTVFDHGSGIRSDVTRFDKQQHNFDRCGGVNSRRFYRSNALMNIRFCGRLGGLGNVAAKRILASDAVLDISGGDSFTDLYGPRRFQTVALPKWIALELGKPLILLPQTYGPFKSPKYRRLAADIVRKADMAWARDERSFAVLKDLLGDQFDPQRHRTSVDVAFALEVHEPIKPLPDTIQQWLTDAATTTVGFNVSGLIYNDPAAMRSQYGFKADYRELVHGTLTRILNETDANVLLIPHVYANPQAAESDPVACERVAALLREQHPDRVAVVPSDYDALEMKWIISRCDWFCGTRMHSTIAGLSTETPTAAVAYSPKTQGVFETCGVGDCVVDPRTATEDTLIPALIDNFHQRDRLRTLLGENVPAVRDAARAVLASILTHVHATKQGTA
jgi:polysaccharide pyruvyl transferase WcaK-like protein